MFKWLDKKFTEAEIKRTEQEALEDKKSMQLFLNKTCKMARENGIKDAIYTVWTTSSSIIVTEDFLYFYGSTSSGSATYFHYGEALALNKLVSIESDFDHKYESIALRFTDGGRRYIKTFNQTKRLDAFFKEKAKAI